MPSDFQKGINPERGGHFRAKPSAHCQEPRGLVGKGGKSPSTMSAPELSAQGLSAELMVVENRWHFLLLESTCLPLCLP